MASSVAVAELFPQARRLMHDLQSQMQYVEKGRASPDDVAAGLAELSRQIEALERLAKAERSAQRDSWRIKIKELRSGRDFIDTQLRKHNSARYQLRREQTEREELMARRRQAGLATATVDVYADEGATHVRSQRMVGDYIASSQAALSSLIDQRQRLKGVQRRILDIGGMMGISNSIMRMSERRDKVDRGIVFVGILVTTALLYYAWART